jgi:uncharacterized protein involved in exopolysaccharide biosynthesis
MQPDNGLKSFRSVNHIMKIETTESMQLKESPQIIKNDEVDLMALTRFIWRERKTIYWAILISVCIGFLVAILSPVRYRSSARLLPLTETKSNLGQLGSLAGLAGVNLSSMMGDATGISPELFPEIVGSYPFLNELINHPLNYQNSDTPVSYFEMTLANPKFEVGEFILDYTVRLPYTIKGLFVKSGKPVVINTPLGEIVQLNRKQQMVFSRFSQRISVEVDEETNLVSISVELDEPLIAAQIAIKTVSTLQNYIIRYKTSQLEENLRFIEGRYHEKKAEYSAAQKALYEYRDSYRNLVEERMDIRYQELQDAYTISMNVYQGLAQQLEQSKLAVKKETPVFSIVEPVKVPFEKSTPKRTIILILSFFVGIALGLVAIFGRLMLHQFKQSWSQTES